MNRIIHTEKAPRALGPYSQAMVTGDLLFTAGQIGIDPSTGTLVPGDISDQTKQALLNLRSVLEAADFTLRHLVKTTVFLADLADFSAFNAVYEEFLDGHKPARSTVQVAALPLGACVEIEAVCSRF